MDMAEVMDGAITADAGIITGGVEVMATTMVGGIITITGGNLKISRAGWSGKGTVCSSGRDKPAPALRARNPLE